MLPSELLIVRELLRRSESGHWRTQDIASTAVTDMEDGGIGSFLFASGQADRSYGRTVAEGWFRDSDGVPVVVSLNVDAAGYLYELDCWKVSGCSGSPRSTPGILNGPCSHR